MRNLNWKICEGVLECLRDLWERQWVTNREVTLWYEIKYITGFLIYTCTTERYSFDIGQSCGFVALSRIRSIKVSVINFQFPTVITRVIWPKNGPMWRIWREYQQETPGTNKKIGQKIQRSGSINSSILTSHRNWSPLSRTQHLHRCQVHPKDLNDDRYQGTWGQWGLPATLVV